MTLQEMPSPSLYALGPPGNATYSQNYKYELKGWIQHTITKDWVFWCWVRVAIIRARVHGSQWGDGGQREEGKSHGNGSYRLNSKLIYLFFRGIPSFFKIAIKWKTKVLTLEPCPTMPSSLNKSDVETLAVTRSLCLWCHALEGELAECWAYNGYQHAQLSYKIKWTYLSNLHILINLGSWVYSSHQVNTCINVPLDNEWSEMKENGLPVKDMRLQARTGPLHVLKVTVI